MIKRKLEEIILPYFYKGKAILIFGARQVGKTTMLKSIMSRINEDIMFLNGDDFDIKNVFENASALRLKSFIGNYKYVFIDEAQRVKNIGLGIKIIVDNFPDVQVVATGSSAFELSNTINEPLTGRKYEFELFPLSFSEMVNHSDLLTEHRQLEERLIFGSYPEIIINPEKRIEHLKFLSNSYLYKDLLEYEHIKKSSKLISLLQALALQMGNEVSYNELAQLVGIDKETVEKYIDLLQQSFVIFRLSSLSRNIRNELKKSKKIYFYDTGIRNALIGNFNPLNLRQDVGALWENYFISERQKYLQFKGFYGNKYFWRTRSQSEIDYLEEQDGYFEAFELKFNPNKKAKLPQSFSREYPVKDFHVVNRDNYYEFLV